MQLDTRHYEKADIIAKEAVLDAKKQTSCDIRWMHDRVYPLRFVV